MPLSEHRALAAQRNHRYAAAALAGAAILLTAAIAGCNNTPQAPPVATTERPSRHDSSAYQPRNDSAYARDDQSQRKRRRGRPEEHATPGQFDFYLFNLSWSPEFCATHADSPECGRKLGFVVHGLWPQNADGDYPQHCSDAPGPANPQADTDIFPTASLVEHEWETHGTCSGLTADTYFAAVHKAFAAVKLPNNIGSGSDAEGVTPDALLARVAAANPAYPATSFALSCGNNRLTAIEICLTKDLQPEACEGVRSCRANVVKVTPQ